MWQFSNIRKFFLFFSLFVVLIKPQISLAQIQVLWSEDFEGTWTNNWTPSAGTWEVGIPSSGPDSAYTGEKCAATILAGNYTEPVESRLERYTSFTVPSASENPRLRFWHWYSFSHADYAEVQIKTEHGNWENISEQYTNTSSSVWTYPSFDLSAYADSTVQIAFYFYSSNWPNDGGSPDVSSGWYIDDIKLITGPITFNNPDGFESGIGDWDSDKGTWEIGEPSSGPGSAYTGNKCAATVLAGDYNEPVSSRLISPRFMVPSSSENPHLRFWHWYSFSDEDSGVVQIKTESGNWENISKKYTNTSSSVWTYPSIDLSTYADSTVQIAFYFYPNNWAANGTSKDVSSGWYIDDIELITGPINFNNPDGFESGIGDWDSERGTWEIGEPNSGPGSAYTGDNCAATVLAGNYNEPVSSRLISPVFTVPSSINNPRLNFWHWFNFSYEDYGEVYIKTLQGDWELLSNRFIDTSSDEWTFRSLDLKAYADSSVQIAFYFFSVNWAANGTSIDVSSGWYIDDIEIIGFNSSPSINIFTAYPTSGEAPLDVSFEVEANDADGSISAYYWDFNGDGLNDDTTSTGTNDYIYTDVGTFNATCRVVDDQGTSSSPSIVQINVYSDSTRIVSVPDDSASADATFLLPIRINDISGIAGAEFKLNYNPAILEATNVSSTALTTGFTIADSVTNGSVAITMARAHGLPSGSGDFVNITFHVLAGALAGQTSLLTLEQVSLYDADTNPISSTIENGLFTVKQSSGTEVTLKRIYIQPGLDTLSSDQTALYTAFGVDTDDNTVEIDVTWNYAPVFGTPGGISPSSGHSTVFTATGAGDGLLAATYSSVTDTLVDTAYVIVGNMKGDINIDAKVNVPDAILCLQIAADMLDPSLYQNWAADYTSDHLVNSADAVGILTESLKGLLPKIGSFLPLSKIQSGPAVIFPVERFNEASNLLSVSIYVENRMDVCGMDLTVDYDTSGFELVEISSGKSSSLLVKNMERSKLSTINLEGLLGENGEVIHLNFQPLNNTAKKVDFKIQSVSLFDQQGNAIETVEELNRAEHFSIPENYILYQNYPNPFNPSTTIRYDVPRTGEVSLVIYNVKGQIIRPLIQDKMNAGTYTVTWRGDDNRGHLVSSGVYFYKIVFNNGAWQDVKKMLFVK